MREEKGETLESYNFPKLDHMMIHNLNTPIKSKGIQIAITHGTKSGL